jgi:hypothetical protein
MMKTRILWLVVTLALFAALANQAGAQDWSVSLYGGRVTSEDWGDLMTSTNTHYEDAHLVAVTVDWTVKHYFNEALTLELEANAAKYFGAQDHGEFNLPLIAGRWHRFPWQRYLGTSFAWGIGPSYATEVPEVEAKIDSESDNWMVYWFGEFTFGPPGSFWSVLFRLHHRSEAFGLVAENGGANSFCAGLRVWF